MRSSRLELRVEPELLARIDKAAGDVPRSRWVVRVLEQALDGEEQAEHTRIHVELAQRLVDEQRERDLDIGPPVAPERSPYEDDVPLPKIAKRKW
jgi:hypothetical protein